jgi:hypothetical protein
VSKKWKEVETEFYFELLVFFAALFFTCVVGIIELLPELENINGLFSSIAFTVLYAGLVAGIDVSIGFFFWLYKGHFRFPLFESIAKFFRGIHNVRNLLLFLVSSEFVLLYLVKIGIL